MAKCQNCNRGPAGIEGHPELYVHTMGGGQMQFKCRTCGCMWMRRYAGDGGFIWAAPGGEHAGAEVPGTGDRR